MNRDLTDEQINALLVAMPSFWHIKDPIERNNNCKGLNEFYSFILKNHKLSYSQLFQDLFVDFIFQEKEGGRFLEFGATNGKDLSNSFMLEKTRNWTGVLAEPDPQWHDELRRNRPNTEIITDCIYSVSGKQMNFIASAIGELSSLSDHALEDSGKMSGNADSRMADYNEITVSTVSLNEVCEKNFSGQTLDFISVDTEGSEYEILSHFDFDKHRPTIASVEHNFSSAQDSLDALFYRQGYVRLFRHQTEFDAWYVDHSLAQERELV